MENVTAREGRTIATIAYLTFIGTIIAFLMNREKRNSFALFHIRQMFGLIILLFISNTIYSFNQWLGEALWVISFAFWAIGLYGAITMKELKVPFLGGKFQEWFRFID
ncbi:hypothetical protein ACFQ1M_08690 [Sungkyunkwania multivorans]|uniref:Uncharacterized protein n=1 Tax=Sungkyunkwania multivorans TaxID=1173618 RepID=A0ABW3CXN2_9FLAO